MSSSSTGSSTGSSRAVKVSLVPSMVKADALVGMVAVVVDQLRASTTICTALANGAKEVKPYLEPMQAMQAKARYREGTAILGGERMGRRIEGFDCGNSPAEFSRDKVSGKVVLFTTTNGTRVLYHAARAERVVVGCLANLNCLVEFLEHEKRDVHIVCAGVRGELANEDVLAAGAIVSRLMMVAPEDLGAETRSVWRPDDGAMLALGFWRRASATPEDLLEAMRVSIGGRNLVSIRMGADVALCTRVSTLRVVPEFDRNSTSLRGARLPKEPPMKMVGLEELAGEGEAESRKEDEASEGTGMGTV